MSAGYAAAAVQRYRQVLMYMFMAIALLSAQGSTPRRGWWSISGDSTRALFFGGAEPENVLMARSADCSTLAGGLCAGSLSISGGMVLAGSASGSGGAILSSGEVCISGGQVTTISGGEDSLFSVAGPNGGLCPGCHNRQWRRLQRLGVAICGGHAELRGQPRRRALCIL